jgi:hypothetical protein
MQNLPLTTFRRCVTRYRGQVQSEVRDMEVCLRAQSSKLYHVGIGSAVARNTLANANAVRDWRIYADFAQSLIGIARPLYAQESFGVDLQETVYALDTTTIVVYACVCNRELSGRRAEAILDWHRLFGVPACKI